MKVKWKYRMIKWSSFESIRIKMLEAIIYIIHIVDIYWLFYIVEINANEFEFHGWSKKNDYNVVLLLA